MKNYKNYYITTPIYYVNAEPHIGTAYTTVLADTMARYHRGLGEETYFLTGTDEHGDKIAQTASKKGIPPQQFVDEIADKFKKLWPILHIVPNRFIRTTEADHVKVVQDILQKVYDSGDIYFGEYGGYYCVGCERFRTEKELVDGKCPDHGTVPEFIEEKNYFFRMSKYQDWLIEHIEKNKDFIRPERYRNEALGFLREPLEDLCISRPKSRLTWGIEIPFDKDYVTYVWFDALINYLTGIGYGKDSQWEKYWSQVEHVTAKDILKPHGIYWPTMLKAAGIEPFQHLTVHGYWTFKDAKISKSASGPLAVEPLVRVFGADAIRYFLMRDMVVGLDAKFTIDGVVQRINSDLANDLGNLLSRVTKLVADYFDEKIPDKPQEECELTEIANKLQIILPECVNDFRLHNFIEEIMQLVRATNKYFETAAPWALVKTDKRKAGEVLYNCAESLRIAAILLYPIMPERMGKLLGRLGEPVENFLFSEVCVWGRLRPGAKLNQGDGLFPRIDEKQLPELLPELFEQNKSSVKTIENEEALNLIEIQDFAKVDLRVATVLKAETVQNTDKLLKLQIEIAGKNRQIIAGIAQHYKPEQLVGRSIIVVANLKPAKLRGEISEGMLLAAKANGKLMLITVDGQISSGATVG